MDDIDDIFVARLMTTDLHTVTPDTLVEDAAAVLLDNDVSSVLVVENDRLVGILTTTDFVDIVARSQPKAETTVDRYMSTDPITVGAQDSITDVAATMVDQGIHHVPIVDDEDVPIGIITTSDFAAYVSTAESAPSP